MPKKKYDFKIPERPPTIVQRLKMEIIRATNNFQLGFDGSLTPFQLGALSSHRPIRRHEVVLADMLKDKDAMGMIKQLLSDNRTKNRIATSKRKLRDLYEDSRTETTETDTDGTSR